MAGVLTQYASDVRNVLPRASRDDTTVAWGPFPEFSPIAQPAESQVLSARGFTMPDGAQRVVVGTATKLFFLDPVGDTLTDVSGATYNASVDGRWHFDVYGQNIIAVNPNDNPQRFVVGDDAAFSDLAGTPPRGRMVSVWKDQLVIANLNDNAETLSWSEINDITDWSGGNADTQPFPGFGAITAISRGNTNFVVQEYGIQRGIFTGSGAVFEFDMLTEDFGCRKLGATAFRENRAFFLSDNGFKAINFAGEVEHIGFQKVDRWFSDNVDATQSVTAVADPVRPIIYWGVTHSADGPSGRINTLLAYDILLREWSRISVDLEWLFAWRQQPWTFAELDVFGTLEDINIPLNSQTWSASFPLIGGADGSRRVGHFSGEPKAGRMWTGEFAGVPRRRSRVRSARPLIDTSQCSVRHCGRDNRGNTWTAAPPEPVFERTQEARINRKARWHCLELQVDAGAQWTLASGLESEVA